MIDGASSGPACGAAGTSTIARLRAQPRYHWSAVTAVSRALLERQILSGPGTEVDIYRKWL